jgi:hypothetical protein
LRDFFNAQIGETLPANASNRVLITASEASPTLSEQYSGSDFRLSRQTAAPPALPKSTQEVIDILRWWLLRDSTISVPIEHIILWVRADVTQ